MDFISLITRIADALKEFDTEAPVHKAFQPGIGPFGEPQLVRELRDRLAKQGLPAKTYRTPDLGIGSEWALEFKIVRPFGDNGKEAENWSVNLLHPYEGNTSLVGDGMKLRRLDGFTNKGLVVVGYEHEPVKIRLEPLIRSFELIARNVAGLLLGDAIEERRSLLVHPEHQVLRCIGWQLL